MILYFVKWDLSSVDEKCHTRAEFVIHLVVHTNIPGLVKQHQSVLILVMI